MFLLLSVTDNAIKDVAISFFSGNCVLLFVLGRKSGGDSKEM
jgi:hypothetical protein